MTDFQLRVLLALDEGERWAEELAAKVWPGRKWHESSYGGPSKPARAIHWQLGKQPLRGWVRRRADRYWSSRRQEYAWRSGAYTLTEEGRLALRRHLSWLESNKTS